MSRPADLCSRAGAELCAKKRQLRHLRIEQFNKYLLLVDSSRAGEETMEDTIEDDTPENQYVASQDVHHTVRMTTQVTTTHASCANYIPTAIRAN